MILLCIALIIKFSIDPTFHQIEQPQDIFMSIQVVRDLYNNHNIPSLDALHRIPQNSTNTTNAVICFLLDYILVYGTMILAIWESLFSFYRYYTTKISSNTCQLVSTSQVLIRFVVYIVIFVILFSFQMQIYYWIFPIIILLHAVFNFYCNILFASILITKYKHFLGLFIIILSGFDLSQIQIVLFL